MTPLDAPLWATVPSSPGPDGRLAARLLQQVRAGDTRAYEELHHQLCHQGTVGVVAYLAVPHLVEIARTAAPAARVRPLALVGYVEASRQIRRPPALPDAWRAEYLAAVDEARALTAAALGSGPLAPHDAHELLAALAAFHGLANTATHLFYSSDPLAPDCGVCGEPIEFRDEASRGDPGSGVGSKLVATTLE